MTAAARSSGFSGSLPLLLLELLLLEDLGSAVVQVDQADGDGRKECSDEISEAKEKQND